MTAGRIHLAVVGGSEADDTTCRRAEAVGEALARRAVDAIVPATSPEQAVDLAIGLAAAARDDTV